MLPDPSPVTGTSGVTSVDPSVGTGTGTGLGRVCKAPSRNCHESPDFALCPSVLLPILPVCVVCLVFPCVSVVWLWPWLALCSSRFLRHSCSTSVLSRSCLAVLLFWFLSLRWAWQDSKEPWGESGLLLLSHLLPICPHWDVLIGAAGATSLR